MVLKEPCFELSEAKPKEIPAFIPCLSWFIIPWFHEESSLFPPHHRKGRTRLRATWSFWWSLRSPASSCRKPRPRKFLHSLVSLDMKLPESSVFPPHHRKGRTRLRVTWSFWWSSRSRASSCRKPSPRKFLPCFPASSTSSAWSGSTRSSTRAARDSPEYSGR